MLRAVIQGPTEAEIRADVRTLIWIFAYICTASLAEFEPRVWINGVTAKPDVLTAHAELYHFKKLNFYCREYFTNCLLSPRFLTLVVNHTQFYFEICRSVSRFVPVDDRLAYGHRHLYWHKRERAGCVCAQELSIKRRDGAKALTCSRSPAQTSTCCVDSR